MKEKTNILQKANELSNKGIPFVLATVVETSGETPARRSFKLIITSENIMMGTVGGGELERLVQEEAEKIFKSKESLLRSFELTESETGIGMTCGGKVKVFFEYFGAHKKAILFGAGHLCKSTVPLLKSLGFHCHVVDNRKEFATEANIPQADLLTHSDYLDFLRKNKIGSNDTVIIFTHGHIHDHEILNYICKKQIDAKYVGMIGSKTKVRQTIKKITDSGYTIPENLHAPIGLNIGKTTTAEISLAIAAEILAVYNKVKKVKFLKDDLIAESK